MPSREASPGIRLIIFKAVCLFLPAMFSPSFRAAVAYQKRFSPMYQNKSSQAGHEPAETAYPFFYDSQFQCVPVVCLAAGDNKNADFALQEFHVSNSRPERTGDKNP